MKLRQGEWLDFILFGKLLEEWQENNELVDDSGTVVV